MKRNVRVQDLKKGMHIILPASWLSHPFLKNSFTITSDTQIQKLIDAGFKKVVVEDSTDSSDGRAEKHNGNNQFGSQTWKPEGVVPYQLREALADKTLAPKKKADVVYKSSLIMMDRLLEDPKAENIQEAKKGITKIVDLILSDNATSKNLLTISSHDFYTYAHSVNVGILSVLLSKELFGKSSAHNLHELGAGFFLHDIGKVSIDPAIINKPGKLTDEEMATVRLHPNEGYKILSETKQLTEECKIIVSQHHERQDGTGYPRRLKGEDIHTYGRICCIADVSDVVCSNLLIPELFISFFPVPASVKRHVKIVARSLRAEFAFERGA
jgi:HD-GYP domain-containing protein (c-di-GMP phosphodiesterase class II)